MSLSAALLIILGLIFILLLVLNILKAINTAKATGFSFVNSLQCATNWCPPTIDNALPVPPAFSATSPPSYSKVAQRYCADLIGRITLKTTPYVVENPANCDLIYMWADDTNYPSFCLAWQLAGTKTVFVAIRGTMSFAEVIVDLDYTQKALPRGGATQVLVHSGFSDLYERIHPGLIDALAKISNDPSQISIYMCGHSLGAGVATLGSIALIQSGYVNTVAYVFASPRVGNVAFSEMVASNRVPLFRLENACDLVPTLPFSVSPNFEDTGSPYMFEHAGSVTHFSDNRKSLQNNHLISAYIDFLI